MKYLAYEIYFIYGLLLFLTEAIVGLSLVKKKWRFSYRLLVMMVCANFLFELLMLYGQRIIPYPLGWLYNVWVPLETATYFYFFSREATHTLLRRSFGWLLAYLALAITVSFIIQKPSLYHNNITELVFVFFGFVIVSCAAIIDLFAYNTEESIFRVPAFWIAGGLLVDGSMFATLFSIGPKMLVGRYVLYMVFSYVGNSCLCIGLTTGFIMYSREFSRKNQIVT